MKTILAIIALFSLCGTQAQLLRRTYGRELPRGEVRPCPSPQSAAARDGGDNAYFRRITEWTREGDRLSADFTVPFSWANRQVLLRLESVSGDYEVIVGGRTIAYDADGNTPAEFNITRAVKEGRNRVQIAIRAEAADLESWKRPAAPQIGAAWVLSQPTMRIRDVAAETRPAADSSGYTAQIAVAVKSDALNPRTSRIWYELLTPAGHTAVSGYQDLTLDMRREDTVRFLARIPADSLWSTDNPHRYTLRLKSQHEGRYDEYAEYRLGFRSLEMHEGTLRINGRPQQLQLREVPVAVTAREIAELRREGVNTLLPAPGAGAAALYEACDSIGMFVIAQAPIDTGSCGESRRKGGNPSNDPACEEACVERVRNSYHTAKRHPSVIAFSLARRSANGIGLYESYLYLKSLGDARPVIYPEAAGEWNSDPLRY